MLNAAEHLAVAQGEHGILRLGQIRHLRLGMT
jgi:hypothetical protein